MIDVTWGNLADILNKELRDETEAWTESAYRKKYQQAKQFYDDVFSKELSNNQTTLDKIKGLLGEQYIVKKQIQDENRELNKVKKDLVKSISISEDVIRAFKEDGFRSDIPECCHSPIVSESENKMICVVGDWHIGYKIINCKGNYFNWDIANERINQYIDECYRYIDMYNIKKVYIINIGDMIEGCYMRKTQNQYCEFMQGVQIEKFTQLMYRFITSMSVKANVVYDAIAGNHDRFNGDKTQNYDGDNLNSTVTPLLRTMFEISENNRVFVTERDFLDKEIILNINGLIGKFVHGHEHSKDDKSKIKNEISMDNQLYDFYVEGHWHNYRCVSENNGRYLITNGCLSGYNDYSTAFGCSTIASQTIMIIGDRKLELIKDIPLG